MVLRRAVGLLLTVTLVTGCAAALQENPMDPRATLTSRSTSAEAVARYDRMQKEIRDQLDAAFGPFTWEKLDTGMQTPCPDDVSPSGSVIVFMDPWGFDGEISEADWPRAKEIVIATAARYGLTDSVPQVEQPDHRQIIGNDPDLLASYSFSTERRTFIQITTGCHRPTAEPTSP